MAIGKRNKDHLKELAGVALVAPVEVPKSEDPLRFWTGHRTEDSLVDLRPFADGEFEPSSTRGGNWAGQYTGRPELIGQLAQALQARLALAPIATVANYTNALRAWWRLFDRIENTMVSGGRQIAIVKSLADLNELHEAAAHRVGMSTGKFRYFICIANDARRLHKPRLPDLRWEPPKPAATIRTLIPEGQARELKTVFKQDWERVRHTWSRNDAIRDEAARRDAGLSPRALGEEGEQLLKNWQHFQRIQKETGRVLPSSEQLLDGINGAKLSDYGLERRLMRSILFPTVHEADIAFHLALMNSSWNPSTMASLDGSAPDLVFDHPKDEKQIVLSSSEGDDEEVTMQAGKPRARGKTQFCTGLRKHSSSPPMVVAAYLRRVEPLREILKADCQAASEELARLRSAGGGEEAIEKQYKLVQKLRRGCRNVWLYVNHRGEINWLNWKRWRRYGGRNSRSVSHLDRVLERLNSERARRGESLISNVTPSDFRDINARWVYLQTNGNILAVMLSLGHSSLGSTGRYLENNIFAAENDEHARRFMIRLFAELDQGRVDLTILSQLVRHGPLTLEMEARLAEYRKLMRSRVGVGCADPRNPPEHVAPSHKERQLCGTQRCLKDCPHAKFMPESVDGIAMRVEELQVMSDRLPRETWLRGGFQEELDEGEAVLDTLYPPEAVAGARDKWRQRITDGAHLVPGLGRVAHPAEVA
jgi:hypothetical protein